MSTQDKFRKEIWPVIGPFILLATSRKGLIWLVGAVLMLLFAYAPGARTIEGQLSVVLLAVFGFIGSVLIAAIGYEDGQLKGNGTWPKFQPVDMTPIVSPIISLLRSRKFLVWISTLIVGFLVTNVPWLSEYNQQLTEIFIYVFGAVTTALLGATAYEDGKLKQPAPTRYVYAHPSGAVLDGWERQPPLADPVDQAPRPHPVVVKSASAGDVRDAEQYGKQIGIYPKTGTDG